jgi:hypothetical protein
MKNPSSGQKVASEAARDEGPWSMLIPTGVMALGLIVIGFANAVIVTILLGIYPL